MASSFHNPHNPHTIKSMGRWIVFLLMALLFVSSIPSLYRMSLKHVRHTTPVAEQFPVTVNPQQRIILESDAVNKILSAPDSPLQASAYNVKDLLWSAFANIADFIANLPLYQSFATAGERVVTINAGLRKEQVASVFGKALGWTNAEILAFQTAKPGSDLPLFEGTFLPDSYVVASDATPADVQKMVNDTFTEQVLSHYGASTESVVPLEQALNIASIIQRETLGTEDMRLVSGILWNRLFVHMNLQVDSTLQYAKSTGRPSKVWWPEVTPADKYIKSPYNTYQHEGLPPTAIANPSVAAILAALNPIKTSCLFYFNDQKGNIICTDNYKDHVAQLKKYYGQGK